MLNLLTKTKPWMIASLMIVATSVFGKSGASCNTQNSCAPKSNAKPCPQPCPPTQICESDDPCCPAWPTPVLNAAYNYPARIQTRCPWDFYLEGSFIFWQPSMDNLEIGIANTTAVAAGVTGNLINMDFNFKPGFKVAAGANLDHDNWDVRTEYTWFHSRHSQSSNGTTTGLILPTKGTPARQGNSEYNTVSGSWRLNMDIVDLDMGRWCYVGTKFVCRPSFGARADWIRQRARTTYTRTNTVSVAGDQAVIEERTTSWAVGPKVAVNGNWNLGEGFRVFGNSEADLLFTKYTTNSFRETHTDGNQLPFHVQQRKNMVIRPHLDLEMGLGWGMYLDCNNWYMDIALGYEFQVFFDQNMFRHFTDNSMQGNSQVANGNLYIQGLTASFRLDF